MLSILVNVAVFCCILAVAFWALQKLGLWAKLPDVIQNVIIVLAVVFLLVWIVQVFRDGASSHYLLIRL